MELRILRRKIMNPYGAAQGYEDILQFRELASIDNGHVKWSHEWKDVPIVEEE